MSLPGQASSIELDGELEVQIEDSVNRLARSPFPEGWRQTPPATVSRRRT